MASSDLVAKWDVTLSDKVHRVEFEHGTTTGKRIIRVDGNVCELNKYSNLSCHFVTELLEPKIADIIHLTNVYHCHHLRICHHYHLIIISTYSTKRLLKHHLLAAFELL